MQRKWQNDWKRAVVIAGCHALAAMVVVLLWTQLVRAAPPADTALLPDNPVVRDLVYLQRGTIPVVISSPHGGRTPLANVPVRKDASVTRFVTLRDENAMELALTLASELEARLGGRPYVVVAQFERRYVDANRAPEAAFESELARAPYETYHAALRDACREIANRWQAGLLLDIHGQAKHPDSLLRGTRNLQTVSALVNRFGAEAIDGPQSLFGHLAGLGYDVQPKPGSSDRETKEYTGGYIVAEYGSHMPGGIDAFQLEFGRRHRIGDDAVQQTAADLAAAVISHCEHYLPAAVEKRPLAPEVTPKSAPPRVPGR